MSCLGKTVSLNTPPTQMRAVHRQTSFRQALARQAKEENSSAHGVPQCRAWAFQPSRPQVISSQTKATCSARQNQHLSQNQFQCLYGWAHDTAGNTKRKATPHACSPDLLLSVGSQTNLTPVNQQSYQAISLFIDPLLLDQSRGFSPITPLSSSLPYWSCYYLGESDARKHTGGR